MRAAPKRLRSRKKKRKKSQAVEPSIGLKPAEEQAVKRRLRGNHAPLENHLGEPLNYLCSEPWIDAQFKSFDDVDADGNSITYRFYDPRLPSGMTRCRGCGRLTPPQNVGSSGHCDDCRIGGMSDGELARLPRSPGVIDMGRLKGSRRRGEETPS